MLITPALRHAEAGATPSLPEAVTMAANVLFNAWLVNDTNNFYDQLTITVRNNSTNATEVFYERGTTWTNCTSSFSTTLAKLETSEISAR